jgi:hypothetical protein
MSASEKKSSSRFSLDSKTGGLVTTSGPARQTKKFKRTE